MSFLAIIEDIKEELSKEDIDFRRLGSLLLLAVSFMREEVDFLFPQKEKEQKTPTKREERQEEEQETPEEKPLPLDWLYEYSPPIGRPKGSKPTMTLREFFQTEILPLHKHTDYNQLAKEVRELILVGKFKIKNLTDFLAFLHAYMMFEDVDLDIKEVYEEEPTT